MTNKTLWLIVESICRGKLVVIANIEVSRRNAEAYACEIVSEGRGTVTVSIETAARLR